MVIYDYTTLLRPFGEKIRLKANFFLTSLDYTNYAIKNKNDIILA